MSQLEHIISTDILNFNLANGATTKNDGRTINFQMLDGEACRNTLSPFAASLSTLHNVRTILFLLRNNLSIIIIIIIIIK